MEKKNNFLNLKSFLEKPKSSENSILALLKKKMVYMRAYKMLDGKKFAVLESNKSF